MGLIGDPFAAWVLKRYLPSDSCEGTEAVANPLDQKEFPYRLEGFFGNDFCEEIRGKTVADFGCGKGRDVVEMVLRGASKGIGLELREELFEKGHLLAEKFKVGDRCEFKPTAKASADVVISVDAFEHFENPGEILGLMAESLKQKGVAWISFGPTWYHPRGGHLFSVFPWAHLILSEKSLIRWRSQFKDDGATRFGEVAGGLNQISIRRFKKIIRDSPFEIRRFELVPIKGIRLFTNLLTREFLTSCVRCRLQLR